ncbi:MAG: metal ABC transporter permease [Acidimicrobiia bacterium]|nr:metal ABC transporter permease [Acidimicrobiia bacterium]
MTAAVQVVGVLLIFALLVTPGAIADRVCRTPARAIGLCVVLAVAFVWAGLAVTYYSRFPVGFLIAAFAFTGYLMSRAVMSVRRAPRGPSLLDADARKRDPVAEASILSPR